MLRLNVHISQGSVAWLAEHCSAVGYDVVVTIVGLTRSSITPMVTIYTIIVLFHIVADCAQATTI